MRSIGLQHSGDNVFYALGERIRLFRSDEWPTGVDSVGAWQAFDTGRPLSNEAKRNSAQADREQFITSGDDLETVAARAVRMVKQWR